MKILKIIVGAFTISVLPVPPRALTLHEAAANGDVDEVRFILNRHFPKTDVNTVDRHGDAPLHYAARNGHAEVVRLLCHKGAFKDAHDEIRNTPLHYAASAGHEDVVDILLKNHADVNAQGKFKNTPLHVTSSVPVAKKLLAHHANINASNEELFTPLHKAIMADHTELATLFITKGAYVNIRDKDGRTPLHIVCNKVYPDQTLIKLLLEHGAAPYLRNHQGETAIDYSA